MNLLGRLCRDRGDLENAEEWFSRSAELDFVGAIENLGALLRDRGAVEEAKRWLLVGANHGSLFSMNALGNIAWDDDERTEAEEWYRKAVSCGDTEALVTIGSICRNRGDFGEAATWFQRAIDEGIELGSSLMIDLDLTTKSMVDLNRIRFSTFEWETFAHEVNVRAWRHGDSSLVERYLELAPDFESWDASRIRSDMIEFQDYVESPSFDVGDLEIPKALQSIDFTRFPTGMNVLDVECFEIDNARCVLTLTRHRIEDVAHFSALIFVLFSECFWLFGIEIEANELVGAREGAVAGVVIDQRASGVLGNSRFDPYDSKWDGLIPLEDDPLTRIRILVQELRQSIQLDESLLDLATFRPTDD